MQTASMTSGSGTATIDSYVTACKCNELDSFTCSNTPLTPNGILNICIQSTDSDVELAALAHLEMFQENSLGNQTLNIVSGFTVQNSDISSLLIKNATAIGVASVVPTRFFSYNGISYATISGVVYTKLVGGRRVLAIGVEDREMREASEESDEDGEGFSITVGFDGTEELPPVALVPTTSSATKAGGYLFVSLVGLAMLI